MRWPLLLTLLAGAASAEYFGAWKTDTEYQYDVDSRTMTGLPDFFNKYSTVVLKAVLTVRPQDNGTLQAKISNARFAQATHADPSLGGEVPSWEVRDLQDAGLEFKKFPISDEVFVIKLKNCIISELIVSNRVPTWEVNVLKSIVSQLHISMDHREYAVVAAAIDDHGTAKYDTMEDSVGGKCKVSYQINNHGDQYLPQPEILGNGTSFKFVKLKDYCNCERRTSYHFGNADLTYWEDCPTGGIPKFLSRSSTSRITVTGELARFTIQYSITAHDVSLNPIVHGNEKGIVRSQVALTLARIGQVDPQSWTIPTDIVSVGNLVYSYSSSFDLRNANAYTSDNVSSVSYNDDKSCLFSINYRNNSIFSDTEKRNATLTAKRLAVQIGRDLDEPSSIPEEQTLEKFTNLVDLVRTMRSTVEIAQVESELQSEFGPNVRTNIGIAFRDAVAQAGTVTALVTIRGWILDKKIRGIEAASVIGVLSTSVRNPTSEYVDIFFKMITDPTIADQEVLNSTAITTFGELFHHWQMNGGDSVMTRHRDSLGSRFMNRNPIYCHNNPTPKSNPENLGDHIEYMFFQLRKSIEKNEYAKSHVFIRALGNMAHHMPPSIFAPYLKGEIPATTFQRLLMVYSLQKVSTTSSYVRRVLHKIYRNTTEVDEIRSAAVAILVYTEPSEIMLREIIEFMDHDNSNAVKSVVRSSIQSASLLDTASSMNFRNRARKVLHLLKNDTNGFTYAQNIFGDYASTKLNYAHISQHYANIVNLIDLASYTIVEEEECGNLKMATFESGATIANARYFTRAWHKYFKDHQKPRPRTKNEKMKFSPEEIISFLKMNILDPEDEPEGAFWMRTKYDNKFVSLDKEGFRRILELLSEESASLKDGRVFNVGSIKSNDMTLSFPMESGFPFLYNRKMPAMLKLSGAAKVENSASSIEGSIDLGLVYSTQIQAHVGFVTPFDHQYHMAGVNTNFQTNLPFRVDFNYEKIGKRFRTKLQPIRRSVETNLFHYSVVPFVSHYSIPSGSPIIKNDNTSLLISDNDLRHQTSSVMGLKVDIKDDYDSSPSRVIDDLSYTALFRMALMVPEKNLSYTSINVHLPPGESSQERSFIFTTSFETLRDTATKYDENRSKSRSNAEAPKVISNKMNDPQRRSHLLAEAMKGIAAADGFAVDVGIEITGTPIQWIGTWAQADSTVDEKGHILIYQRFIDATHNVSVEECLGSEFGSYRSSVHDADAKFRDFDIDVRVGKTCESGSHFRINGNQEQSDGYRESQKKAALWLGCPIELDSDAQNNSHCRNAIEKMLFLDKSWLVVKFGPESKHLQQYFSNGLYAASQLLPNFRMSYVNGSADQDTVKLSMDLSADTANFEYDSGRILSTLNDIKVNPLIVRSIADPHFPTNVVHAISYSNGLYKQICTIDSTGTKTFDNAKFPINLGECWHVAMMTLPKASKDTLAMEAIDQDMFLSILVRDSVNNDNDTKAKDVQIVLVDREIKLTKLDSKIQATIDGVIIDLAETHNYRYVNGNDEVELSLVLRSDNSLLLTSEKHEIDAVYDGTQIRITAYKSHAKAIRGLCGNFDNDAENDFLTPEGCIATKSSEFVAAYALTSTDCPNPPPVDLDSAEKPVCRK